MNVWIVSPEVVPFSKTGGLADVVGALPRALARQGADVCIVTPRYRSAVAAGLPLESLQQTLDVRLGGRHIAVSVETALLPNSSVRVYLLRADEFFDRDYLYGTPYGDYGDNLQRFALLSRATLELALALGEQPDLFHLHDWQTGLVPVYARTIYSNAFARVRTVMTVHNLAYQGMFPDRDFPTTGLDWRRFNWRELEFYGRINLLKGGLVYADAITTVSPTYARQIQQQEFGCGLDGVLRARADDLYGVLNGVDTTLWDPKSDPHIPEAFEADSLDGKVACKAALQKELGLAVEPETPLVGMVGRFAEQKGFELVVQAAPRLAELGLQVAVLGSGDRAIARRVMELAARFPRTFAVRDSFDDGLAHRIEAGADLFLMPSLYEPCGLGQIYAMKYGTVPVVRATGGLADTVDAQTGFSFDAFEPGAMMEAVRAAVEAFRNRERWSKLMRAGMSQNWSWDRSARDYLKIYRCVREAPPHTVAVD